MSYKNLDFLMDGEMILLDAKVDDFTTKPYFFIKDKTSNLEKIGNTPLVEIKGIVFETSIQKVMLLIMFRLNKNDDLIYCQWCNYYNQTYKKKLDKLIFSDKLNFCTVDSDNKKYTTFECDNSLRFIVSQCSERAKGRVWPNEEFKKYAMIINRHYKNRVSLFNEAKYYNM